MTALSASNGPGKVLVCPTSHLDWDWYDTFAEYFQVGPPSTNGYAGAVNAILSGVCQLLSTEPSFCYSLAEVGYLQAFLAANPDALATLLSAGPDRFVLMGGGITSPDNLMCHGEVFIRNYLVGRRWLESVGLHALVAPVAWLPDDFGHDPQLPVVLAAMGLPWLGLSRVPGSPQPFANQPIDGSPSVADQLNAEGLVFPWIAGDGSLVLAHYMPSTYGAVWDGSKGSGPLQYFVEKYTTGWPTVTEAPLFFAPAGGDFVFSQWNAGTQGSWLTIVADYNQNKKATDPGAMFGTFPQFMTQAAGSAGTPRSPLLGQNYWTGIFASRPALKTLHYRAAQLATAAEAAATLLRVTSTYSAATLDDLDAAIDQAWQTLVPSSHHDYITGTSPDRVYWSEQLPMLEQAARLAGQCLTRAVGLIAAGVTVGSGPGGDTPVVVFNPLGFARAGVVHLPAQAVPGSVARVSSGSASGPVQRAADGGLLFLVPGQAQVGSFGYTTVTLQPGTAPALAPLPAPSEHSHAGQRPGDRHARPFSGLGRHLVRHRGHAAAAARRAGQLDPPVPGHRQPLPVRERTPLRAGRNGNGNLFRQRDPSGGRSWRMDRSWADPMALPGHCHRRVHRPRRRQVPGFLHAGLPAMRRGNGAAHAADRGRAPDHQRGDRVRPDPARRRRRIGPDLRHGEPLRRSPAGPVLGWSDLPRHPRLRADQRDLRTGTGNLPSGRSGLVSREHGQAAAGGCSASCCATPTAGIGERRAPIRACTPWNTPWAQRRPAQWPPATRCGRP